MEYLPRRKKYAHLPTWKCERGGRVYHIGEGDKAGFILAAELACPVGYCPRCVVFSQVSV